MTADMSVPSSAVGGPRDFSEAVHGQFAGRGRESRRAMDFSAALLVCKEGAKIARSGWNGKDMYVVHQSGYPEGIGINANTAAATGLPQGTVCRFLPYLMFRTAQGDFVPWLASQTDILASDWAVI